MSRFSNFLVDAAKARLLSTLKGDARYARSTIRSTIVLLGDSYENKNGPTPSSGVISNYGQEGYFVYANAALNQYFKILNAPNAGVGGQTCAQIAARVQVDALAYSPDWVLVGGSTNDTLTSPTLVASVFASIKTAYDAVLAAGKSLIVCTRPAKPGSTAAQIVGQLAFNSRVRKYAQQTNAVLFDMALAVSHPDTGLPLQVGEYGAIDNLMDTDNTHLSFSGAGVAGYALSLALAPFVPGLTKFGLATGGGTTAADLIYDPTNGVTPEGNLFKNGKMLGTGGSVVAPFSGNLAAGWTVNSGGSVPATGGSGVLSKVAVNGPIYRGEWQQIAMAPGTSGQVGGIEIFRESATTAFDGSQGLSIGDAIFASMRFETDAANWCGTDGLARTSFSLSIKCLDASYATLKAANVFTRTASDGRFRLPSGTLKTPEISIPPLTAHVFVYVRLDGVGTVRFDDVSGRKV